MKKTKKLLLFKNLKKGFTLGETIASMISLAVVALAAQSLILVSNKFTAKSDRTLASMASQNEFHNMVCSHFKHPLAVQTDGTKSYSFDAANNKYIRVNKTKTENSQATLAFPVLEKNNKASNTITFNNSSDVQLTASQAAIKKVLKHPAVKSFLSNSFDKRLQKTTNQTTAYPLTYTGHGMPGVKLYKIYADSHTLITYQPSLTDNSADFPMGRIHAGSGFIFAARCVKNAASNTDTEGSFIDKDYSVGSILDITDVKLTEMSSISSHFAANTALYVLNLKYRPFYFPPSNNDTDAVKRIKCADVYAGAAANEIEAAEGHSLNTWTPVIYRIQFESAHNNIVDHIADYKQNDGTTNINNYYTRHNMEDRDSDLANNNSTNDEVLKRARQEYRRYLLQELEVTDISTASDPQKDAGVRAAQKLIKAQVYFPRLMNQMSIPIKFTKIVEFPFLKQISTENIWALSFSAISFPGQDSSINFQLFDIENTCWQKNAVSSCPYSPAKAGTLADIKITGNRDMRGYLKIKSQRCPFRYSKMDQNSGYTSMGYRDLEL